MGTLCISQKGQSFVRVDFAGLFDHTPEAWTTVLSILHVYDAEVGHCVRSHFITLFFFIIFIYLFMLSLIEQQRDKDFFA
jgi:hypothetical protein